MLCNVPNPERHNIAVVTTLRISDKSPADTKADALVIGVTAGPDGPLLAAGRGAPDLPRAGRNRLAGSLAALAVTGKTDQVIRIPSGSRPPKAAPMTRSASPAP